jgi:hypothetical protein
MRARSIFQSKAHGIRLGGALRFEISTTKLGCCNIALEEETNATVKLNIDFEFDLSQEDAVTRLQLLELATWIIEELILKTREPFDLPRLSSDNLAQCRKEIEEERRRQADLASPSIITGVALVELTEITCSATGVVSLGDVSRTQVMSYLSSQNFESAERLRRHFTIAMKATSTVEKFTYLYNILLEMAGDKQSGLDALIKRRRPSTVFVTGPRGSETSFTQRRNELAHTRPGATLEATAAAISDIVGELVPIVAEEIEARRASSILRFVG